MSVMWDTERAATLARKAYRYVARVYPPDASLEPLDVHQDAALQAQAAGDFQGYQEALREMCRAAKKEALEARRSAA
jgi:hypothetical protein